MQATRKYDTHLDSKRRLTICGAMFDYYHVVEYDDGKVVLEPRVLAAPFEVSQRTLSMMDTAMESFQAGRVSAPVDLSAFMAEDDSSDSAEDSSDSTDDRMLEIDLDSHSNEIVEDEHDGAVKV